MKHIVIMGATSGIGLGVAHVYARAGWRVGVAGRNREALEALARAFPDNVVARQIDVTSPEAPLALLALISDLGGMDIYLHASGIYYSNPALNVAHETAIARTNVTGFTALVDTAFRYFSTRGERGLLAAITSVASTRGIGEMPAYSASKRYQTTYLDALEQLAVSHGFPIDFCDIRPGWTRTPLIDPTRSYPMSMSVDKVVADTVRALIRRRRLTFIDLRWRLLCALWRRLPRRLWPHIPYHTSREK